MAAAATLVVNVEGTLLRSGSFFPYYILVALEAGSPLRAFLLLALWPLIWALESVFGFHSAAVRLQVLVSTAGIPATEIQAVSRAVLPKFLLEDLHPSTYRSLFCAAGNNSAVVAISSHPRLFLEHFLSAHLLIPASSILATDLLLTKSGLCTGFVCFRSGVLDEPSKLRSLRRFHATRSAADSQSNGHSHPSSAAAAAAAAAASTPSPLIGVCIDNPRSSSNPHPFLSYCKDIMFLPDCPPSETLSSDEHLVPLVFHDGRLVMRPTPFNCVAVMLWVPIGITVAILRILTGLTLPCEAGYPVAALLGVKVRVKGAPPLQEEEEFEEEGEQKTKKKKKKQQQKEGVLFVCSHRSLADPTFLTLALRRKVRALAYSISKVSELIAPIKATRLTRNRDIDSKIIDDLLTHEDLFMCPEGTTCREPYLLRFSPLFAELAERVVPVALNTHVNVFHGTTARGFKFLDAFFFLMNPRPFYHVHFLDPISIKSLRHSDGMSTIDIANLVQKRLATALSFTCTNFNRRDKYTLLAGHDGNIYSVSPSSKSSSSCSTT